MSEASGRTVARGRRRPRLAGAKLAPGAPRGNRGGRAGGPSDHRTIGRADRRTAGRVGGRLDAPAGAGDSPTILRSRTHPAALACLAIAITLASCAHREDGPRYAPRVRDVTLTAVPLLTKEMRRIYPFLARDFAPGGVLEGREVYAFLPASVTVVEGDTVRFHFVNPEDDAHTFVLGDLALALPGQSVTDTTWLARRAGVYAFTCNIASHQPSMWGQVVVLAPGAVAGVGGDTAGPVSGAPRRRE